MKRIKITKELKKQLLKDFTTYLDNLKPGDKVEYKFDDKVETSDRPKVILSQTAYIKIKTLVSNADGEVGWNGSVTRDGNKFTVNDIFVYPQTVTSATVTCDELETSKWLMSLPTEVFNSLRFQAHSHVNMGISPSGVDKTMYEKYLQNLSDEDFYIFMIFNKKDEYYIEINDNKNNCIYYKSDIDLEIEGATDFWTEVSKNIKKPTYTPTQVTSNTTTTTEKIKYKSCKKASCKDCEYFYECAEMWYKEKHSKTAGA